VSFLVPNALYLMAVPILSRAHRDANPRFLRLSTLQLLGQSGVGVLLSVLLWALAPTLIHFVFGPGYELSALSLRLLSPLLLLKSVNFGLGAVLTSSGWQARRATAQTACAVFNVAANLVVIRPFGVAGVALVYVLSEMVLLLGYSLALRAARVSGRPAIWGSAEGTPYPPIE